MDREGLLSSLSEKQLLEEAFKRRFLYREVESLIQHDFLTHTIEVGGVVAVFRSLNPSDYHWCEAQAKSIADYERWVVAYSLWSVDGLEIPAGTEGSLYRREVYKSWALTLGGSVLDTYYSIAKGLKNRVERALRLTEAFCYEPYSRSMWRFFGRDAGSRFSNPVRQTWVAFNLSEDDQIRDDRQWSHTTLLVGAFSGKASKSVSESLDKIQKEEKTRRNNAIEEAVNWVVYGEIEKPQFKFEYDGKTFEVPEVASPTTVEELEEEMRRVASGEEDFHDQMVSQYHERARQAYAAKQQEVQQKRAEARKRMEERNDLGQAPLVGYTPEQLAQMGNKAGVTRSTAVLAEDPQKDRLYNKFVAPKIKAGKLNPDLTVSALQEEGKPSLQERVAARKPVLP